MSTRVTVKGQVTIPKEVRQAAGIMPGDEVEFTLEDTGAIRLKKVKERDAYRKKLDRLRGTVALGMSVDEYMRLIRDES